MGEIVVETQWNTKVKDMGKRETEAEIGSARLGEKTMD